MNLSEIHVDPGEAEAKAAEYAAVTDKTPEDKALAQAYAAAAKSGRQLISLTRTIAAGGWHEDGLPRLAVARAAGTRACQVSWNYDRELVFADIHQDGWAWENRGALVAAHTLRVPVAERPPQIRRRRASAPVPLVPPRHRPTWPRPKAFHVLWEVDEWSDAVPVDPALIRHILGDLWAVHATWNLTDLERLVLAQS
jgi:hypothetical protein